ncbi:MAG: mechanosensitive ion channel family protein [Woeseiaceae bacterium]|nr:mechanosensitive ion channel family protein [Woeseiaceae bacterium]
MWLLAALPAAHGQDPQESEPDSTGSQPVAEEIAVSGAAGDDEIAARLRNILEATGWFESIDLRVDNGVVFLDGIAPTDEQKTWAGSLARNTDSVVAVVNNIEVAATSPWDLGPTLEQIRDLAATAYRNLPLVLIGGLLLIVTLAVAGFSLRAAHALFGRRIRSNLLRDVLSRAVAVLVFVFGVYVVLRISGLTGLAVTIVGGTGLLGLAIGFAFRDIAENFLASILISIQRPFAMGDLIEIEGRTGFVQRVTTRATLIMTRDGNHVQIPNATVYKNTITNFTANPRTREEFTVGIGYEDSIADAQSTALGVLREHPAILDEPEPLVLVEKLGAATVILRVQFWIDIERFDQRKVRSAAIRLIKTAFDNAGISMPDEAREVVFPAGVPVTVQESGEAPAQVRKTPPAADEDGVDAHQAEGGLTNDDEDVEKQARESRLPEGGQNLL